jgi:molybdopterin-guanine dinucleotide biosynthesis protein A
MGRAKQHIVVGDESMGQAAIAIGHECCEIVVVAGPADAMQAQQCVADLPEHTGMGPLAGIEAVLASGLASRWLIIPCDMPGLDACALQQLLDVEDPVACLGNPQAAEDRLQLPLAIDATLLRSVREFLKSDRRSIGAWLESVDARIVMQAEAFQAQNVNAPEDLPGGS